MTDTMDLPIPQDGAQPAEPPTKTPESGGLEASLRPILEELDREREGQKSELMFRIAVAVLGAGALAVVSALAAVGTFGSALQGLDFPIYIIPPLGAAMALGYWANQPRQRYISAYKSRVLPAIAGSLGEFRYDEAGKIGTSRLTASTLLPHHDDYKSEDKFTGSYKGVEVELAEAKLTKEQGSGKDRKTVTVFKGLFVLLSTHKPVNGKTVIKRDAGAIANWLGEKFGGLERVALEDPAFEERFEVYGTDQIEARYLLTPAFMERLTTLAMHMGDGRLQAAFYDERFFVMVPNSKDLFEPPSIFTSVMKDTGVRRISREFGDVLSIIDILKLDERTGL